MFSRAVCCPLRVTLACMFAVKRTAADGSIELKTTCEKTIGRRSVKVFCIV